MKKKLILALMFMFLQLPTMFAEDFNVAVFMKNAKDTVVRQHILSNPEQINKQFEPSMETFLISAVMNERYDLVQFLLEQGADPNITSTGGGSPLSISAGKGNFKIVELLLNFKADPNLKTGRISPLMTSVCELNLASVSHKNYFDNALKVIDLLMARTTIEEEDFSLPERTIKSETDTELKQQKTKLLEIIKAKAVLNRPVD